MIFLQWLDKCNSDIAEVTSAKIGKLIELVTIQPCMLTATSTLVSLLLGSTKFSLHEPWSWNKRQSDAFQRKLIICIWDTKLETLCMAKNVHCEMSRNWLVVNLWFLCLYAIVPAFGVSTPKLNDPPRCTYRTKIVFKAGNTTPNGWNHSKCRSLKLSI